MYCELVCGPPGSGKTTYCEGKRQFLSVYDPTRPVVLVNLDPANEGIFPYPCDVDIRSIVQHAVVADEEFLGPNGAYLFCGDVLLQSLDELSRSIQVAVELAVRRSESDTVGPVEYNGRIPMNAPYLIIDCPGQVEFYLHHDVVPALLHRLEKKLCCQLCVVHLMDAQVVTRDVSTYVSSCLLALSTMAAFELPHMNVLTKWDLVEDPEDHNLFLQPNSFKEDRFVRLWDKQHPYDREKGSSSRGTEQAQAATDDRANKRGGRRSGAFHLAEQVLEVVEGYGLVGFEPLNVQSSDMMFTLTQKIDHAMGFFA